MSHSASPSRQSIKLDEATEQLHTKLLRLAGETIGEYGLIKDGDKIMVCLSGGKDSQALLDLLLALQRRAPIHFDLVAVNLDQKQPGFPAHVLSDYLSQIGMPFHIEERDTYSIVKRFIPEGQTTWLLCSRFCRGILYRVATELGATKITFRHHRDDIVEASFLNLFYAGKLNTMPPKLRSKDGRHVVFVLCPPCKRAISFGMQNSARFPLFAAISVAHKRITSENRKGIFARMGEAVAWLCRQHLHRPVVRGAAAPLGPTAVRLRGSARIRPDGRGGRRLVGSRP
jgi:PP-loop family protein